MIKKKKIIKVNWFLLFVLFFFFLNKYLTKYINEVTHFPHDYMNIVVGNGHFIIRDKKKKGKENDMENGKKMGMD